MKSFLTVAGLNH